MLTKTLATLLATSTLAAFAGGCDPQADDGYPGESLATIRGQVTNELPASPAAQVTILWTFDNGNGDEYALDTVDVEGEFPAAFTLNLYGAPAIPDGWGAIGYFLAVDPATFDPEQVDAAGGLLGMAEHHAIIYLAQPTSAIPEAERAEFEDYLGGPLDAGFTLFGVGPDGDDADSWDDITRLPADASIEVRMAPIDDLQFPNIS